jgi:hypothetical protein
MEQEEQFASRKNIQKSSNFLIQGKNKKYIQGPMKDQDGNPRRRLYNGFGGLPQQSAKVRWVVGGLPQQSACEGLDSNPRIAIAAKVLVQSKNLVKQKGSPDQCFDDANTLQHLPLLGRLLRVVPLYDRS